MSEIFSPQQIIQKTGLLSGMKVLDLGTGPGFFALAAAQAVGEKGQVYIVDINPEILDVVLRKAQFLKIDWLKKIIADLEKPEKLKIPSKVDLVILNSILYILKNKEKLFLKIDSLLKENGKLMIVEWVKEKTLIGPHLKNRIAKKDLIDFCQKKGFKVESEEKAGPYHYVLILKRG